MVKWQNLLFFAHGIIFSLQKKCEYNGFRLSSFSSNSYKQNGGPIFNDFYNNNNNKHFMYFTNSYIFFCFFLPANKRQHFIVEENSKQQEKILWNVYFRSVLMFSIYTEHSILNIFCNSF